MSSKNIFKKFDDKISEKWKKLQTLNRFNFKNYYNIEEERKYLYSMIGEEIHFKYKPIIYKFIENSFNERQFRVTNSMIRYFKAHNNKIINYINNKSIKIDKFNWYITFTKMNDITKIFLDYNIYNIKKFSNNNIKGLITPLRMENEIDEYNTYKIQHIDTLKPRLKGHYRLTEFDEEHQRLISYSNLEYPCCVIDYDLILLDYIDDDIINYDGKDISDKSWFIFLRDEYDKWGDMNIINSKISHNYFHCNCIKNTGFGNTYNIIKNINNILKQNIDEPILFKNNPSKVKIKDIEHILKYFSVKVNDLLKKDYT